MKKNSAFIVCFLLISLVLSGCGLFNKGSKEKDAASEATGEIVAIVNGEAIYEDTLKQRMFQFKKNLEDVYGLDMDTEDNIQWLEDVKVNLLDDLIWEVLLLQEANNLGLTASKEAIDDYYEELKAKYPSEDEFLAFLKDMDFSIDYFKELIRDQILMDMLLDNINKGVQVSDEEIQEHFEMYTEMYDMPERVAAKHLLYPSEEEALEVLNKIKQGTPFDDFIEDGDDLGYFQRGMMVQEFEEAAFNMDIGDLVGPIESMFGFHIITVYDKLASKDANLEDAKAEIYKRLVAEKQNIAFDEYLDDIYLKSSIEKLLQDEITSIPN